jgi:hypothetical protein
VVLVSSCLLCRFFKISPLIYVKVCYRKLVLNDTSVFSSLKFFLVAFILLNADSVYHVTYYNVTQEYKKYDRLSDSD